MRVFKNTIENYECYAVVFISSDRDIEKAKDVVNKLNKNKDNFAIMHYKKNCFIFAETNVGEESEIFSNLEYRLLTLMANSIDTDIHTYDVKQAIEIENFKKKESKKMTKEKAFEELDKHVITSISSNERKHININVAKRVVSEIFEQKENIKKKTRTVTITLPKEEAERVYRKMRTEGLKVEIK